MAIRFCPWCGTELPNSTRDSWFEEMERLGIDPWVGEVPHEFQDDEWMRRRGL